MPNNGDAMEISPAERRTRPRTSDDRNGGSNKRQRTDHHKGLPKEKSIVSPATRSGARPVVTQQAGEGTTGTPGSDVAVKYWLRSRDHEGDLQESSSTDSETNVISPPRSPHLAGKSGQEIDEAGSLAKPGKTPVTNGHYEVTETSFSANDSVPEFLPASEDTLMQRTSSSLYGGIVWLVRVVLLMLFLSSIAFGVSYVQRDEVVVAKVDAVVTNMHDAAVAKIQDAHDDFVVPTRSFVENHVETARTFVEGHVETARTLVEGHVETARTLVEGQVETARTLVESLVAPKNETAEIAFGMDPPLDQAELEMCYRRARAARWVKQSYLLPGNP